MSIRHSLALFFTALILSSPLVAETNSSVLDPVPAKEAEITSCWGRKTSRVNPSKTSCQRTFKPMIAFKTGYFFFSSANLRKIYSSGGLDLQLSGSTPIWRWLQIYGSVEYLTRHGKLLNSGRKTQIWEIPISLGLQPAVAIHTNIHFYLTLGPRYFFVHQHNHSPYLDKILTHSGVGGFVNTGFHFFPVQHLLLDVFGEYSYKKMRFHGHKTHVEGRNVQVGGFTFGAGIGYAF